MEQAAGVRHQKAGTHAGDTVPGSPVLIKYADDLVALCHTRDEAEQVKARLAGWLAPRGLAFNEGKTRIVTLDDGFDFLGVTVRRQSGKLLIKPSKAALRRVRERLRTEVRALRGANAAMVLVRLNPIIRGWAAYYRTVVSRSSPANGPVRPASAQDARRALSMLRGPAPARRPSAAEPIRMGTVGP